MLKALLKKDSTDAEYLRTIFKNRWILRKLTELPEDEYRILAKLIKSESQEKIFEISQINTKPKHLVFDDGCFMGNLHQQSSGHMVDLRRQDSTRQKPQRQHDQDKFVPQQGKHHMANRNAVFHPRNNNTHHANHVNKGEQKQHPHGFLRKPDEQSNTLTPMNPFPLPFENLQRSSPGKLPSSSSSRPQQEQGTGISHGEARKWFANTHGKQPKNGNVQRETPPNTTGIKLFPGNQENGHGPKSSQGQGNGKKHSQHGGHRTLNRSMSLNDVGSQKGHHRRRHKPNRNNGNKQAQSGARQQQPN